MTDNLKIVKNSLLFSIITFTGSLVSLAINSIIAAKFGVSYLTDGFIIVIAFYQLIILLFNNTFGTIFIPHFVTIKENYSEGEAWLFSSRTFNNLVLISAVISLIFMLFSGAISRIIALGYVSNQAAIHYIIRIFRLFAVFFFFSNLATLCTAILVARGKIVQSSFFIIIQNVIPIISALLFERVVGVYSLVYGYLISSFINFIVYFGVFLRKKRYYFSLNFTDKHVKNYYKKLLPWFSSNLLVRFSPILETAITPSIYFSSFMTLVK